MRLRTSFAVFASLHISPRNLAMALKAREGLTLLDVRKPEEDYDARNLPGSRLVTVELTFEILDSWPKDALLVFYSNNGRRSLDKAAYFRAYGFRGPRSLTGGLLSMGCRDRAPASPGARMRE